MIDKTVRREPWNIFRYRKIRVSVSVETYNILKKRASDEGVLVTVMLQALIRHGHLDPSKLDTWNIGESHNVIQSGKDSL